MEKTFLLLGMDNSTGSLIEDVKNCDAGKNRIKIASCSFADFTKKDEKELIRLLRPQISEMTNQFLGVEKPKPKDKKRLFTKIKSREFKFFIHTILENISLGITIDWMSPNIEIHLPFCFIKIGWVPIEAEWGRNFGFGINYD